MSEYFTPAAIVIGLFGGAILAYISAKREQNALARADQAEQAFYNRLIETQRVRTLNLIENFGDADF